MVTIGDDRPDHQGARRGRRRVSRADRAAPPRITGALLPDAWIPSGRRGRPPGHAAGRLARPRRIRRTFVAAHLALPDCPHPRPRRAPRAHPTPRQEWDVPDVEPPEPSRLGEIVWLEPFPDALLEGAVDVPLGPEARYEQTESISLAFITALQVLPPRQLAVLILRDVLGFRTNEVADILDATVESVNSALKRARASLRRGLPPTDGREPPPAPDSPAERALVGKFVRAYESGDVDALVALLTADVGVSMPPVPLEYHGRDVVARFYASIFRPGREFDLVPTRANGQPAYGVYRRAPTGGSRHGSGILVLTLTGDRICAMTRFDNNVLPWFGLPRSLPS